MKSSRGSVLLGALIMITLLSLVLIGVDTKAQGGSGFMQVVSSEHRWVQRDYLNAAAINLAEAGLERGADDIAKSWSKGINYVKSENLGLGSYTVKVIGSTATTYTLESSGTLTEPVSGNSIKRKLQLTVKKGKGNDTPYAILTRDHVNFKRASVAIYNAPTIGIYANGDVKVQGSLAVYGPVGQGYSAIYAAGKVKASGSVAASEQKSHAESIGLPSEDMDALKKDAKVGGKVIEGNYTVTGGTIGCDGVTYIKGNLKLEGNVTAKGYIAVEGNVDIKGTFKPAVTGKSVEVISKGNIDIDDSNTSSGGPEFEANFYTNGHFKMKPGSPWIKGSVVADGHMEFTADNAGSFRLDYVAHPASKLTTGAGTPTVEDWTEVY